MTTSAMAAKASLNAAEDAVPGSLLGMDQVVSYMLHHFALLYAGVIVFSAAELVFGLFLMLGYLTRLSALVSVGISVVLMVLLGWQGATCIDEWTMAVSNFAMGVAVFLAGSAAYSLDGWMMRRNSDLRGRGWFQWLGSAPWPTRRTRRWSLIAAAATALFTVLTYNHYRGAVFTPYHGGPVSPVKHHISLSQGTLHRDGSLRFTAYLDAGTPSEPANVIAADLIDSGGVTVKAWDGRALKSLPRSAFANDYAYNQFGPGYAGISAGMGARAVISLPAAQPGRRLASGGYVLVLHSVNGRVFRLRMRR